MRLLLDTHVLLWALGNPHRLGSATRLQLEDPANEVFFSAASIWEIAIKARLGRVDFTDSPRAIAKAARDAGFTELPVWSDTAASVAGLPLHHRDPFDRLLVAQAIMDRLTLYTADHVLPQYSKLVLLLPG